MKHRVLVTLIGILVVIGGLLVGYGFGQRQ